MTQSATVKRYTLCYRCGVIDYKRRPDCNHPGNSKPMVLASDYDALAAQCAELQQYRAWAEPQVVQHGDDVLRIADLQAQLSACQQNSSSSR